MLTCQEMVYTTGSFNRLSETDSYTYTYDDNGNMIERAGPQPWTIELDRENRIISVSNLDRVDFQYDALGRRISSLLSPLDVQIDPPLPTKFTYS